MSEQSKKAFEIWEEAKIYIESLGYELGEYIFDIKKNVILKDINSIDGCKEIIGYIDVNDLNSIEINKY